MKKLIISIVCLFTLIGLTSCNLLKNSFKTLENGAVISVTDELKPYFLYQESLPSMEFGYPGVNVTKSSTNAYLVFVQNDFYKISETWSKHLASIPDDEKIILSETEQLNETTQARFGKEFLPLDPEVDGKTQKCSMEYHLVSFGKDGTRYSYVYRTFVSNNVRYYAYAYTDNLTITMEMPLMVINDNGENKLLLLPLPFDTKYEVSGATLTVNALIKKDTYYDEKYYTFNYPSYLSDLNETEQVEKMTSWYEKYCNGEFIDDELYISYAGARFKVDFNQVKNDKKAFKLIYLGSK